MPPIYDLLAAILCHKTPTVLSSFKRQLHFVANCMLSIAESKSMYPNTGTSYSVLAELTFGTPYWTVFELMLDGIMATLMISRWNGFLSWAGKLHELGKALAA